MSVKRLGAVSAYAIAVEHGFTGTEAEWLEYLKGHDYILTSEDRSEIAGMVASIAVQNTQPTEANVEAWINPNGDEETVNLLTDADIDKTLSVEGKAADAKAVGQIKADLSEYLINHVTVTADRGGVNIRKQFTFEATKTYKVFNTSNNEIAVAIVDANDNVIQDIGSMLSNKTKEFVCSASGNIVRVYFVGVGDVDIQQLDSGLNLMSQRIDAVELTASTTSEFIYGWIDKGSYHTEIGSMGRVVAFLPIINPNYIYRLLLGDIDLAGDYLVICLTSERSTDTSKRISTTYKYNAIAQTYDISLTDEQKKTAKYIMITSGSSNKSVKFSTISYIIGNNSVVDSINKTQSDTIHLYTANRINANNITRRFEFDGYKVQFYINGELKELNSDIPYDWDVGSGLTKNLISCVYSIASGKVYMKRYNATEWFEVVLFTFIGEGRNKNTNRVHSFVECNAPCSVNGSMEGIVKYGDMNDENGIYYGEKLDLNKHYYARVKAFKASDFGTLSHASNSQGFDVYDSKYLYQFCDESNGKYIAMFDFENKSTAEIKVDIEGHGNCLNVGKRVGSNKHPLVYISSSASVSASSNVGCYVVQINDAANSVAIVQTITINGSYISQVDFFVDDNYLYCYYRNENEDTVIDVYNLPETTIQSVVISTSDKLESFTIKARLNQGIKVIGDKIYAVSGLGTTDKPNNLHVIDRYTMRIVTRMPMPWIGEPEGVSEYENVLLVGSAGVPTYYAIS